MKKGTLTLIFNKNSVTFGRYLGIVQGIGQLDAMQSFIALRMRFGPTVGDQKIHCFKEEHSNITPLVATGPKNRKLNDHMLGHGGRAPWSRDQNKADVEDHWGICILCMRWFHRAPPWLLISTTTNHGHFNGCAVATFLFYYPPT